MVQVLKDDKSVRFYTELPSRSLQLDLFAFLEPVARSMRYWHGPSSFRNVRGLSFIRGHLLQRVDEHEGKTAIGEYMRTHGSDNSSLSRLFSILRKCKTKWDCLMFEMLSIRDLKPSSNKQRHHYLKAVLIYICSYIYIYIYICSYMYIYIYIYKCGGRVNLGVKCSMLW